MGMLIYANLRARTGADSSAHNHRGVAKLREEDPPLGVVRGTGVVVGRMMECMQEPTLPALSRTDSLRTGVQQEVR